MAIDKIQEEFEKKVINDDHGLDLDKFEDGTMWGSENLTNCYEDTTTELCFSFYKIGLESKDKDRGFFENKLKNSTANENEDFSRDGEGYLDSFINLMWKYFKLS